MIKWQVHMKIKFLESDQRGIFSNSMEHETMSYFVEKDMSSNRMDHETMPYKVES